MLVLDPQEVLVALQQDALEVHNRLVFFKNNLPEGKWSEDDCETLMDYSIKLDSIEDQINNLFN